MLMQRPVSTQSSKGIANVLSVAELEYMQEMAANRFDQINDILQDLPRPMLLVLRNVNTIRAITMDHGNVVDRYTAMARSATRGAFVEPNAPLRQRVLGHLEQFYFDYNLKKEALKMWVMRKVFYLLYLLGKAPDISDQLN